MALMNAASSVSPASSRSRTRQAAGRRLAAAARLGAGPLGLAGFFLPWAHGPGPFAANEFTGFSLVGFAGRLQALDLSGAEGGALWAVRIAVLGVAIAACWQTLLAPCHRLHPAYPVSGWYLVAAAVACGAIGFSRSGFVVPPPGLALLACSALLFIVSSLVFYRSPSPASR